MIHYDVVLRNPRLNPKLNPRLNPKGFAKGFANSKTAPPCSHPIAYMLSHRRPRTTCERCDVSMVTLCCVDALEPLVALTLRLRRLKGTAVVAHEYGCYATISARGTRAEIVSMSIKKNSATIWHGKYKWAACPNSCTTVFLKRLFV